MTLAMRLPLIWLGVWVVAMIAVSALQPPDVEAVVRRLFIWGWVGLWCLVFGIWYARIRGGRSRRLARLYSRLALTPPDRRALAAAGGRSLSSAYLLFAVVVVAFATVLLGVDRESSQRPLLLAMIGFVGAVGLPLAAWALRAGRSDMGVFLAPLGLGVIEAPDIGLARGFASGRTRLTLEGAQVFEGERRGRAVSVVQRPDLLITSVEPLGGAPWPASPPAPGGAEEMAALMGEAASSFDGVTVTTTPEGVRVERRGPGAGRHLLLDLALAEAVAESDGAA